MQSHGELVERSPGPTFKAPDALEWVEAQESALCSQHPKGMPVLMDVRWWLTIELWKDTGLEAHLRGSVQGT